MRSALPITQRPPSARIRSIVSAGIGPAATSPPNTIRSTPAALDVRQHGVERRDVAVDVVERRDPHVAQCYGISTTLPVVARLSSAACAAAASASGKRCTAGVRLPSASGGERPLLEVAHAAGALQDPRADRGRGGQAAAEEIAGAELRHRARRVAEQHEPAADGDRLERLAAQLAADAVERHGDVADALGPAGDAVVDRDVGAERAHALDLLRAAGGADDGRAGGARRLHEQAADPARRGRDQHDVGGA